MKQSYQQGFALPVILIMSISTLIIATALVQTLTNTANFHQEQYYTRLAEQAAEAGLTLASACMSMNANQAQWTSALPLKNTTDCYGRTTESGATPPKYNGTGGLTGVLPTIPGKRQFTTRFDVPVLVTGQPTDPNNSTQNRAVILANGYVDIPTGGQSVRTIKATMRKIVNWGGLGNISAAMSAPSRSCAIRNSKLFCWGSLANGQLGIGGAYSSTYSGNALTPAAVNSIDTSLPTSYTPPSPDNVTYRSPYYPEYNDKSIIQSVGGTVHTCALTSDGQVWCWGANYTGAVGNSLVNSGNYTKERTYTPSKVNFGSSDIVAKYIAASAYNTCAIIDKTSTAANTTLIGSAAFTDKIVCWGSRFNGALGYTGANALYSATSTTTPAGNTRGNSNANNVNNTPIPISTISAGGTTLPNTYKAIKVVGATQQDTFCMIALDTAAPATPSRAYCWGDNTGIQTTPKYSAIGNGNTTTRYYAGAQQVTSTLFSSKYVTDIAIDGYTKYPPYTATYVANPENAAHGCLIAASSMTSNDGVPYCWGSSQQGQVGNSSIGNTGTNTPIAVMWEASFSAPYPPVKSISTGLSHTCMLGVSGVVYCWGLHNGGSGAVGVGETATSSYPLALDVTNYPSTPRNALYGKIVTFLTAAANRTCAIGAGFAYCWGDNKQGQIGNPDDYPAATNPSVSSPARSKFLEMPAEQFVY